MIVLVTGTGRSGTSYVARLLHEELGLFMGYNFVPANRRNPLGYYEDKEFLELHKRINKGEMLFEEWSLLRGNRPEVFGIKDPQLADKKLVNFYKKIREQKKVVWCNRNKKDTMRSLQKTYSYKEAKEIYEHRMFNRAILDIEIDIDKDKEEEIKNKLYEYI